MNKYKVTLILTIASVLFPILLYYDEYIYMGSKITIPQLSMAGKSGKRQIPVFPFKYHKNESVRQQYMKTQKPPDINNEATRGALTTEKVNLQSSTITTNRVDLDCSKSWRFGPHLEKKQEYIKDIAIDLMRDNFACCRRIISSESSLNFTLDTRLKNPCWWENGV